MKKFIFTIIGVGLLLASPALAQEVVETPPASEPKMVVQPACSTEAPNQTIMLSGSTLEPTAAMWFYQQERRDLLNPKLAVQRLEAIKGMQRRQRIAARKWFGYSNLRPRANPDPINGYYSPSWGGNNRLAPYMWSGCGYSTVILRPNRIYR